jgi:hypothetical protein
MRSSIMFPTRVAADAVTWLARSRPAAGPVVVQPHTVGTFLAVGVGTRSTR